MNAIADDLPTLEQDAALDEPLRRVAYEAGMLLGLEATRDEQEYHRRRLSRQQYWLHGYGTLAGMRVRIDDSRDGLPVIVGPGLGIDRLGREVLVHEPYCIVLRQWLEAQNETRLREGYADADDRLWLKVTVRYKDCPVAAQPVLARKLNLSTDAVQPSRTADSILLELGAELPPSADPRYAPWGNHGRLQDAVPGGLNDDELALISGPEAEQMALHARLLYALDDSGVGLRAASDALDEGARLLLARIAIDQVTDINDIQLDPARVRVNNMVRPFLQTASQLAYLARTR